MSGSGLSVFTDFMLSVGPDFLTGAEDIVNDALKQTYILPRFINGKSMKQMVQGGNSIKDNIFLGADSNPKNYKPNATFTYRMPQVLTQYSVPWRFTEDDTSWTDQQIELSTGGMSTEQRFQVYKDVKYSIEQNVYTGMVNFVDDQCFAAPDVAEMEDTDGGTPYSVPVFVTENGASGAIGEGTVPLNGPSSTAWTTVIGISPSTKAGWRNLAVQYGAFGRPGALHGTSGGVLASGIHIFTALSRATYRAMFDRLPVRADLSEPTSMPSFWATSLLGVTAFEESLRENQTSWGSTLQNDPSVLGINFRGMPVIYIRDLDTAAIYPGTAGSLATEAAATATGPRYFGLNGKYFLKVIHSRRYFAKKPPFSPTDQPFTTVMVIDMWHNLHARSRKRQVIVYPSQSVIV